MCGLSLLGLLMARLINVGGVAVVYSGTTTGTQVPIKAGKGTVFTYRAYGTTGQSVEVRGGFPGDAWEDMQELCVLTVGGTVQSAVLQHSWPVLMVDGTATIKIARGEA